MRPASPWPRGLAWTQRELFHNTPLLLLVYFVFFRLPQLGIMALDKIGSFVLTLSLDAEACLTAVSGAGLEAVPKGNIDVAKAIGLRLWQRLVHMIWPVMFQISLPGLGNYLLSLCKDSSLAAAIAVPELTFTARRINANTLRVVEAWPVASGLDLATAHLIAFGLKAARAALAGDPLMDAALGARSSSSRSRRSPPASWRSRRSPRRTSPRRCAARSSRSRSGRPRPPRRSA